MDASELKANTVYKLDGTRVYVTSHVGSTIRYIKLNETDPRNMSETEISERYADSHEWNHADSLTERESNKLDYLFV